MSDSIIELYRHNLWANLKLLDLCASLSDEILDASAPGTYGRVRDTLVHLFAAEERYVSGLTGVAPERPLRESEAFPGFDELRQRAQASGEALIDVGGRIQADDLLKGVRGGRPYEMRAGVLLIQAINHATEHRVHVATIITQRGIANPELDGWGYAREKGMMV